MQRVVRSTLVGLLSLAGLTACGDKITNNTPTTTGVTSQVHGVTVTPPSASMNVGDSLTFVATVSADAGITDRTVTWTSSNAAVASVSSTGVVHALAQGTSSIIATSNADKTVSAASVVTVGGGNSAPPTITVSTINQTVCGAAGCNSVPANLANVAGQVDVTFNVDAMGQKLQSVNLVLNCTGNGNSGKDTVVATQTLSSSKISAEAQSSPITLSFNTASFNSTTGAPAFKNGVCTVKGTAVTLNGTTPTTTTSASQQITLNNADVVVISPVISTTPTAPQLASATDNTGRLWNAGAVNVSAIPVMYSGNTAVSGTISLIGAAGGTDKAGNPITAGEVFATTANIAPTNGVITATFPNSTSASNGVGGVTDSLVTVSITTVNSAGNAGPTFTTQFTNNVPTTGQFIRLDNKAPSNAGTVFTANTQNTQNGWIGSSFSFMKALTIPGADSADNGGVDKVTVQTQWAPSGTSTWTTFTSTSSLAETSGATGPGAYDLRLIICDALNNCSSPTGVLTTFGVDNTAPRLSIASGNGPANMGIYGIGATIPNAGAITATLTDSSGSGSSVVGSGFGGTPLYVTVTKLGPNGTTSQVSNCTIGTPSSADASGNTTCKSGALEPNGFSTESTTPGGTIEGLYTVNVQAIDQAGNMSTPATTITYYVDQTAPVVSPNNISVPGTVATGTQFSATATDNLDVAGANGRLNYVNAGVNFFEGGSASPAGTAFDNTLTRSATANVTLGTFYASLATINGGTLTAGEKPTTLYIRALDAANNLSAPQAVAIPAGNVAGTGATPFSVGTANTNSLQTFTVAPNPATVSNNGKTANTPSSTTLTATITAANQNTPTPFTSVCFYYANGSGTENGAGNAINGGAAGDLVLIGCTTTPPADVTTGTTRTFTYQMPWTPSSKLGAAGYNVYAVGVDANTNGMITVPTSVTIVP